MAGIEFNRDVFSSSTQSSPQGRSLLHLLGPLFLLLTVALVGLIAYKVYLVNDRNNEVAAANAQVQELQQQLADMQKRMETLEKHRKPAAAEVAPASSSTKETASAPRVRTVYKVASGSVLPPQTKPTPPNNPTPVVNAPSGPSNEEIAGEIAANREAWQATTNRLADVVGVVGEQQGEIGATKDALNQLLSQTKRQAVSFELDRGTGTLPVGPVRLQFKSSDTKTQHYTLCVFFDEKCIEIKNRALNEVVVFVVAKGTPPMELVATKIQHDQIVGYMEIPSGM
jgi:hypothetical protein